LPLPPISCVPTTTPNHAWQASFEYHASSIYAFALAVVRAGIEPALALVYHAHNRRLSTTPPNQTPPSGGADFVGLFRTLATAC